MKTSIACLAVCVGASALSYLALDNRAVEISLLLFLIPLGVAVGFLTSWQAILSGRKYLGLLGLTQMTYWPLLAGIIAASSAGVVRQVLLCTLITLFLLSGIASFALSLLERREK